MLPRIPVLIVASLALAPRPTTSPFTQPNLAVLAWQQALAAREAPLPPTLPDRWLGAGPTHKLLVGSDDATTLGDLRARGALVRTLDYGTFTLAIVDERPLGGRAALRDSGLDVRDEQDLITFNGIVIDGRRPDLSLRSIDPAERFGEPGVPGLYPFANLYVVQFEGPARDEWLEELDRRGLELVHHAPMNAYVVQADPSGAAALEELAHTSPHLQYVGVYEPAYKLQPILREAALQGVNETFPVTIQLLNGPNVREHLAEVATLCNATSGARAVGPYVNVDAEVHPGFLRPIAAHGQVFGIELRGTRLQNDEAQGMIVSGHVSGAAPTGPGYLAWLASVGFNASQFGSFSVNVVDDATSLTGHPDLPTARVDFAQNPTSQTGAQGGHGFLNANIIAGFNSGTGAAFEDASGFNYGLGIAPWAHVGSTAIFGGGGSSPTSWESAAYAQGARISSNSWSFVQAGNQPIPDYDSNSQEYDRLTRDARSGTAGNQELLVVFSAGNSGSSSNTVSTPATAKNVVTVGAAENWRQTGTDGCGIPNSGANDWRDMISFSSRGPVNSGGGDGRWKPEIVAPGTHIEAGVPQSNYAGTSVCNAFFPAGQTLYGWSSGTSHSCPAVAGGAALVYQDFLNHGLSAPSPAMMKAVIANSAAYMTGVGANDSLPSNSQGMGSMNLGQAFDGTARILVDQTQVLSATGQSHVVTGSVADAGQPFRVTLVWTDAPGSTTGAPWVNNLDLTVTVGGQTYRGNVFSGASSTAGGTADIRNNTESVFLPAGTVGAFTVTVNAASIAGDGVPGNGDTTDQDFALVVYNGSSGPPPYTANFVGSPTAGIEPLTVSFTDLSSASTTSWSWTFGDGGTSTQQNPSHTYASAGTYSVSLTASDPSNSDTLTRTGYISVSPPPVPGIADGSFELQAAGSTPTTPWSVTFGAGHVINPENAVTSDNGLPSDGFQWAELDAVSTNGATPPSNPGGAGNPPSGGAGISQSFSYAAGQTILSFDAAFLRNETANSTFNDWMSVDITDGSTWFNLYHADTFTTSVTTSAKHGLPMTAVSNVSVDLATIFPSSSTATTFTVTAQVGNAIDNIQASIGYVDNFVLTGTGPVAPTANFTGTPTTGVAPLTVGFSDASTGDVTSWAWTFGDGGSSSQQNPGHTYAAAGTYTVALTATGPGGSDTRTRVNYITVNVPAPTASFTGTPTSGIAPLTVAFTDGSTGSVTAWSWSFGDGGTSTQQSPSHTYAAAGTYTIALTVSGPGGSDTQTRTSYVTVNEPAPVAAFNASPTSGVAPLTVAFTDASSGTVTSRAWSFGDGGTSTQTNPSHTYAAPGTYTVSLTVTGPGGSDTATQTNLITVATPAPVASFTGAPTSGAVPLTVSFSDGSTGDVTSWAWSFGDGGTSTLQNPGHTYAATGTYTVSLTATGPGGSDTQTRTNYITVTEPAPTASFTGAPTSGTAPLAVAFTDGSSGSVSSWSWTFGDGGTSTLQSPGHTYAAAGTYTVSLTVTGPGGSDTQTRTSYISVNEPAPVAAFNASPTSGVAPLTVAFTDASSGTVTSHSWSFGDGGTSTQTNPSHTYTAPGTYTVSLTVTGPGGSDTATQTNLITVGTPPPVADFSGTPTSGVVPLTVAFSDLSGGNVTSWSWTFGDGGTSTAQNPGHTYVAVGTYTVSLTVSGPGGSDARTRVDYVTVSDPTPVAAFTGSPTSGTAPLTVAFTDASTGTLTSWSWSFGDGGTSAAQSPSHTYAAAGTYTVALTVSGPGGSDTLTQVGYVTVNEPAPVASFTGAPTSGTVPLNVSFTDASSGSITSWSWSFGDGGTSTVPSPGHTYTAAGTYTVSLTVSGPGGSDTQTRTSYVTVNEPAPVAAFSGSPLTGTAPLTVSFGDASTGTVTSWSWSFGDGGTSGAQNPSHTYGTAGTYTVSLTVTGPGGSSVATQTDYVTVNPPVGGNPVYYLSFTSNTAVPGVGTVADEDVVTYDPSTGTWALYFDGSDVGLAPTDIAGIHVRADGSILMTFAPSTTTVPGLIGGPTGDSVDDSDVVLFSFSGAPGANTAGSFSFYLDGSDIGLTSNGEDIDALYEFDNGDLGISTVANVAMNGVSATDEDILRISLTSTGANTAGSATLYFDGSDVGFGGNNAFDTDAMTFDPAGDLRLSVRGTHTTGAESEDVILFQGSYGPSTSGSSSLLLDLSAIGIASGEDVDALSYR
jgi:PKD repeat protein